MAQQEQIAIDVEQQNSTAESVDVRREETLGKLATPANVELIMTPDGITTRENAAVDRYGNEERGDNNRY